MPRPPKRYLDPENSSASPLLWNGHPVIPVPALRGLVRALLSKWNYTVVERARLEQVLFPIALSLCDTRLVKRCEDDGTPNKEDSITRTAEYIALGLVHALQPCPRTLLQTQAQGVDVLLKKSFFGKLKKSSRNPDHIKLLLQEQLPAIQDSILRSSSCKSSRPHPSTLPNDETLRSWARRPAPARLRNEILAYYHGFKSPDYVAQLLAGRTS